jgi:hypothetical protein
LVAASDLAAPANADRAMNRRQPTMIGLCLLAAAASSAAIATIAQAAFSSPAAASQSISSRNLVAPGSLTATPSGHDVNLSWTAGSNGNGYQLLAVANGISSNCASATFASLTTTASLGATDTGRYQPQGTYECYQAKTTYNTWTSINSNPTAAAQIGFVASTVAATNGGVAGKLDTGDTIVITYNQPVTPASGPISTNKICTNSASSGNIIMVGDAISGCATNTTVTVGAISGGSSNKTAAYNATWVWTNSNTTLTITIGTRTSGAQDPTITGTLTFTPTTTATSMLSATGNYHNCDTNTGSGNCLPTITGSF